MTLTDSMIQASEAYNAALSSLASQIGISLESLGLIIGIISLWALVWKGIALWKSSKKNSLIWFIILLAVNTMGILEIFYIFVFSKIGEKESTKKKGRKR